MFFWRLLRDSPLPTASYHSVYNNIVARLWRKLEKRQAPKQVNLQKLYSLTRQIQLARTCQFKLLVKFLIHYRILNIILNRDHVESNEYDTVASFYNRVPTGRLQHHISSMS